MYDLPAIAKFTSGRVGMRSQLTMYWKAGPGMAFFIFNLEECIQNRRETSPWKSGMAPMYS